jgi:GDP-mannose 6-dehydrogenase
MQYTGVVFSEASVAVLGLGYVGCVTAACLARLGHRVVGVDRDAHKVKAVLEGHAPFYEPGLEESIRASRALSATTRLEEALEAADIALVCVGTPSQKNGDLDLEQLRRVCQEMGECLRAKPKPFVVAIRSTVFPGTCENVVVPALGAGLPVRVVSNPEFLREGCAVRDFLEPSLIVVGGDDPEAVARVASLYDGLAVETCRVSLRTAEMIKYACNAFHALKIGFGNEVAALAGSLGIDGQEVMRTLCQDVKLNISSAYLRPGFAFGGSCLPKDLRALTYRAGRLDLALPLLSGILPSNEEHLRRAIQSVMELPDAHIGIYGLSFKEDTDDLRESPVVAILEHLIGKGRDARVYDPHIRLDDIYGSNRRFIFNSVPHIQRLLDTSLNDLLAWANCVVITQKPAASDLETIQASRLRVLNLAGEFAGAGAAVRF